MKGDIDKNLAQDSLKSISANFELELLRLIKTLNLISQSKELYKGQITFIQALTDRYKLRLSDFTIKLLDLERKSREPAREGEGENLFAAPKEQALSPSAVADVVFEIRDYLNNIGEEIERNKEEYLQKLDSIYSVYNLQLGASQTDLDLKLRELQKEIARASESNGAGQKETLTAEDVTSIDYVKPSLREHETSRPAETAKPKERNIDYIGPDEPPKAAETAPAAKPKPEIKSTPKTADTAADKEAKVKNSYVIGAGILILGIVVGVLFYDMLMRMWGVEKVPPAGETAYTAPEAKKEPAPEVKPPAAATKAEAPKAPEPQVVKKEEPVQSADQTIPALSLPAVEKEPVPQAAGTKSYTVIGAGANVRSGPGMGNDVVTVVKEGDVFTATGERQGRWVMIKTSDGSEGWISTKVIRETE